jgi:hypothetical protein
VHEHDHIEEVVRHIVANLAKDHLGF